MQSAVSRGSSMQKFLQNIFKGDKGIWMVIFGFVIISILMVFSATSNIAFLSEQRGGDFYRPILKHCTHVLMALMVCIVGARIPTKFFAKMSNLLLLISIILLVMVFVMGVDRNDGKRWISLFGMEFQPSEIARLALINFTAFRLGSRQYADKATFISIAIATGLIAILIFVENISTALFITLVVGLMCVIGGAHRKLLVKTALGVLVAGIIGVVVLLMIPSSVVKGLGRLETGKARIERFIPNVDTEQNERKYDVENKDYQIVQSKKAMARSSGIGVGPGNSEARFFLPQSYSDFIYAIIVEEYGLIGSFVVLAIYVILFFKIAFVARRTNSMYLKLMLMGIGIAVTLQALINMMVAVGIFPVTGQPLPFISRGGTSYIITAVYFAVLLSVSNAVEEEKEKNFADASGTKDGVQVETQQIPVVDQVIYDNVEEDKV